MKPGDIVYLPAHVLGWGIEFQCRVVSSSYDDRAKGELVEVAFIEPATAPDGRTGYVGWENHFLTAPSFELPDQDVEVSIIVRKADVNHYIDQLLFDEPHASRMKELLAKRSFIDLTDAVRENNEFDTLRESFILAAVSFLDVRAKRPRK